jgi:hyaluronan synthase
MPRPHKIGVEVPVYGLSAEELRDTVVSILQQSVPIEVVVIGLNQPLNTSLVDAAYRMKQELNDPRVRVIEMPEPGKRGAMNAGFTIIAQSGFDITVNVDGDTVLDQDAIYTALMLIDAQIGIEAVTSNVNVRNRDVNWLTELTFQRYRYANEQERAAQSLFTGVTCMSGPLMVMWTEHVQDIVPEWAHETFMGIPIGPGDDRSLTMHHLRRGWGVGYSPASVVWTDCPTDVPSWKRQQLRWSRSGKREFVRGWKWMYRIPIWSVFDQFYLMVFPLILGAIIGSIAAEFVKNLLLSGPVVAYQHAIDYVLIIVVVNLINGSIAAIRNRDPKFLLSAGYIVVHLRYLLRIHFHALFTLPESAWLTRGGDKK